MLVAKIGDEKETFNLFIVAFNMPLFVMISGYTSVKSIQRIICWKDLNSKRRVYCEKIYYGSGSGNDKLPMHFIR